MEPPTNITLEMSFALSFESLRARLVGPAVFRTRSLVSSSNLPLLMETSKCLGPDSSAVIYGRLILVFSLPDSSIFAFSDASLSLCIADLSSDRSISCSLVNSSAKKSMIRLSKSSPPRRLLPLVAFTSKTPSPSSRMDTSNVPPPRSKTRTVWSSSLLIPYANAAAVGSFIILRTFNPAILPTSLVAFL